MVYAATGHRLEVLRTNEVDLEDVHHKVTRFAKIIVPRFNATTIISGMAIGWDTAISLGALEHNVPLIAAVPFIGQEQIWPQIAKDRYYDILKHAAEVHIICEGGYAGWKYHARDKWMVEKCEEMIALYNGHPKGGTASTIRYTKQANKKWHNAWLDWTIFEKEAA
jgi:uncharacterized phage-like protein YoqJ